MAIINLTDEEYQKFTNSIPTYKGGESKLYIFEDNQEYKLFKMFIYNFEDDDIKKELMVKKIYENNFSDNIKISDLVYYGGKFVGYMMNPKLNYRKLSQMQNVSDSEKLDYLRKIKAELDGFHEKGIIYGDIKEDNIIVNTKNNQDACLIDIDNVFIDDMKPNWLRQDVDKYINGVGEANIKLDSYMFNLLTLRYLNMDSKELVIDKDKVSKLKEEMNNLNSNYSGDYLINSISIKK